MPEVRCTSCGFDNPAGAHFCRRCHGYLRAANDAGSVSTDATARVAEPVRDPAVLSELPPLDLLQRGGADPFTTTYRAASTVELGRSSAPDVDPSTPAPHAGPAAVSPDLAPPLIRQQPPNPSADDRAIVGIPPDAQERFRPSMRAAEPPPHSIIPPVDPTDGRRCPTCGRTVDRQRRFCDCGAQLQQFAVAAPVELAPPKRPPWRHLFRLSLFRKVRRVSGDGSVFLSGSLDPMTIVTRGLAVFGGAVFLVLMMPPWGPHVRSSIASTIQNLRGARYSVVSQSCASEYRGVLHQNCEKSQGSAYAISDKLDGTAWTTSWHDGKLNALCHTSTPNSAGAGVLLNLASTSDIDRIEITPGLTGTARNGENLPKIVDLEFVHTSGPNTCVRESLSDQAGSQKIKTSEKSVTHVILLVQAVYPPASADTSPFVSITDVKLERKKS